MKKIKELLLIILLAIGIYSCADTLTLRSQLDETGVFGQIMPSATELTTDGVTIHWTSSSGKSIQATLPKYLLPKNLPEKYSVQIIFKSTVDQPLDKFLQGNQKINLTDFVRDNAEKINITSL